MGLGSKARGAAGSKARPGERKPSHSRVDRLGEQEYPGAQDRDKGEVIILISKPAHPLVFPVAINGRYNKPIALNRNLAYSLHREKKTKGNEFRENLWRPPESFGNAPRQPASSHQPCCWFRILSFPF